jgi:hypothetical protein
MRALYFSWSVVLNRGIFNPIANNKAYIDAEKQWYVKLLRSNTYWYEMIVNEPSQFQTKKLISEGLKELKSLVENQLDRRFIYFIATRTKVRFSQTKEPRYSLFGKKLYLFVEIGQKKKIKRITINVQKDPNTGKLIQPRVDVSDKFITFTYEDGNKFSSAIHDFFLNRNINLGITTKIQYVGYTKNPHKRPIDGAHSGLSDILYRTSNEKDDIFIYYNLFEVTSIAKNEEYGLYFNLPNSMIDEIHVDKEGLILEKCLILYFNSLNQTKNIKNERKELENSLKEMALERKIKKVTIHYEMQQSSEYFRFGSESVPPKDRHIFTFKISNDTLVIQKGSLKKLMEYFNSWYNIRVNTDG